MTSRLKVCALAAALAMTTASSAFAYHCAPGFRHYHGVCRPIGVHGYSNPVSGAISGEANGAARGNAAAGPVGAAVGGAVGIATGTLTGTANALSGR